MTDPLHRLHAFIDAENLISPHDNLLVAVSGGLDSMYLLKVLLLRKYPITVAHCNFLLRGDESEGDETFVSSFCHENNINYCVKKFETAHYAGQKGISIQMAARDLRYEWFKELLIQHGLTKIVTAHHKTDNVETILLNMIRGTGLKGMEGIQAISGNKIRPLVCLSRKEIAESAASLNIAYREDSSNRNDNYHRNKLRLRVLPYIAKINPDFEETFRNNGAIVSQANTFIGFYMEALIKQICMERGDITELNLELLQQAPQPKFVLYSIISPYGFNASTANDIYTALHGIPGKQFYSPSHRLLLDRKKIFIQPLPLTEERYYSVSAETKELITSQHQWSFEKVDAFYTPLPGNRYAVVDYDKVEFPIVIRPWKKGDKLKPLGMKGHKKVSDILIDKKIPMLEKERMWVVESGTKIIWLAGLVLSEDYKQMEDTKSVLIMTIDEVDQNNSIVIS